jgi:hypothetical protein
MLFSAKTVPAAYARPFRGVGAPTRGTRFCLARFYLVTSADRAGSGGGLELGPKLAGKVLPGASRTQHLQPRCGGRLGERPCVESGNAASNVEIDSFQLSTLHRADEGARGLHDDLVCRRPSLGKQQRESGGHENGVRDGEQLTRRRFMRDRVTLRQRHRQGMEGVTFSLYARPPFWRACRRRDRGGFAIMGPVGSSNDWRTP